MSNADTLRDASPWHPISNAVDLKHLGKFAEELFECSESVAICINIGVCDSEPSPPTNTRTQLEQEIADVRANAELVIERFRLAPALQAFAAGGETWVLCTLAKRLGASGAAVSRCIIQGIEEREPVIGRINRDWLEDTISALLAVIDATIRQFRLDEPAIAVRVEKKKRHLKQWHDLA